MEDSIVMVISTIVSALATLGTVYLAYVTNQTNKRLSEMANQNNERLVLLTNEVSKQIAKRQGVIDLHEAWKGINHIDCHRQSGPEVVKSVNALALTASLWNHDVIEKVIIYQTYWDPYRELYDECTNCDKTVPGLKKSCKDLITSEITKAYEEMKNY